MARQAGTRPDFAPGIARNQVLELAVERIQVNVREKGYALLEEELEVGLRSIAVPVRGASGQVIAALNVGAQATRVSGRHMKDEFLPVLLRGAQELAVLLP
jgi:IclR family pca regulon transcriptional regulator